MADPQYKLITSYPAATQLNSSDVLPVSQNGVTRKLPGSVLQEFIEPFADAAAESAESAASASQTATSEANYLRNLQVLANTVDPGSPASVTKTGNRMTFNIPRGRDGQDFRVLGRYNSLSALQSAVTSPTQGDAYSVGSSEPYDIYIWNGSTWQNLGPLQGPAGSEGPPGPNEISTATSTSISGLLKGSNGKVAKATAGTDYLSPASRGAANGLATLDGQTKVTAEQASARIVRVTASKTLSLTDAGTLQLVTSTSSVSIGVPDDGSSSGTFPIGTEIEIVRYGAGEVTIVPTTNITLHYAGTYRKIKTQYTGATLKKLGNNEWLLVGNLE